MQHRSTKHCINLLSPHSPSVATASRQPLGAGVTFCMMRLMPAKRLTSDLDCIRLSLGSTGSGGLLQDLGAQAAAGVRFQDMGQQHKVGASPGFRPEAVWRSLLLLNAGEISEVILST